MMIDYWGAMHTLLFEVFFLFENKLFYLVYVCCFGTIKSNLTDIKRNNLPMTTMMIVAVFSYHRFQLAQGIRINNIDIINNICQASPGAMQS